MANIKEKLKRKLSNFFYEKVDSKDLIYLEKIILLIIVLVFTLIALEVNKSISYKKYDRVQFRSAGATLYANLYYPNKNLPFQEGKPLIIYCHGIGSKRDFDLRVPIEFTKRGFYVAALDYQGHGESGGNINNIDVSTNTPALAQDCTKLLEKLKTLSFYSNVNESQVGLIGHSLGGMVVLMNQALNPEFKATVAWAPLLNFTPPRFGLEWQGYEEFIPLNLLNSTNSEHLLIIMHTKDEVLDYQDAVKAKSLTNCTLINITKPLLGGAHQLFSDKVLKDSIKWFELTFFGSEMINGKISITFMWNYVLIFLNLGLLIAIIFLLISYSAKFFRLTSSIDNQNIEKVEEPLPIGKKIKKKVVNSIKILQIIIYSMLFILNWLYFSYLFGLIGIFYASLVFSSVFLLIKFVAYIIHLWRQEIKFSRKHLKDIIKQEFNMNVLVYTTICALYFLLVYLLFSFYYPFAFMWPSSITNIFISIAIFPIYFSIEILFRKILYPLLNFVKSEKTIAKITVITAFIIYITLMTLARSYSYLPSVLFTFIIFLIVTVGNTIIYEHTRTFSAVLVSSFVIIQLFFSAVVSNVIGLGAFSKLF
ncbi:MAG: alpha/beta hydrolase family protein [Candidatus Hodarchaeota archaeon]